MFHKPFLSCAARVSRVCPASRAPGRSWQDSPEDPPPAVSPQGPSHRHTSPPTPDIFTASALRVASGGLTCPAGCLRVCHEPCYMGALGTSLQRHSIKGKTSRVGSWVSMIRSNNSYLLSALICVSDYI